MANLELWELRAEFAQRLSLMYGEEVPAYNTLVEVSTAVNRDYIDRHGAGAERLGSVSRVTAERHGAIRVGSPQEMAQVARLFAAFGMHPVGFYDLRDASSSAVPVVSTAFRPVNAAELARNPFRVFTSMLAVEDQRFFDPEMQKQITDFVNARELFSEDLLRLADKAADQKGLDLQEAEQLLVMATAAFKISDYPVDFEWYKKLEKISAVAADIGGVSTTHINHLTPRVLDIDELYVRMQARGITMIDEIQGPPAWEGPDVLLRQTSFRALAEQRTFSFADGTVGQGELRVRFGEVEQRGIALTPKGRDLYDRMVASTDNLLAYDSGSTRVDVATKVWQENLPGNEKELAAQGLAYFTYRINETARAASGPAPSATIAELISAGVAVPEPIVYEDFLPRSAAGIFQSNLTDDGSKDEGQAAAQYDIDRMSQILGTPVYDPNTLYQEQEDASIAALAERLKIDIIH
jgi:uncharacterized glyoxalase superfamily metalloenzyme YdcJ